MSTPDRNYERLSSLPRLSFSQRREDEGFARAHTDVVSDELAWPRSPSMAIERPHTRNPHYVHQQQMDSSRNSPQKPAIVSPRSHESPSDHVGSVLWAVDSFAVDPKLITRPATSNPKLHRLIESQTLEHSQSTTQGNSVETRSAETTPVQHVPAANATSAILWSSGDVQDWRMLARPVTSNPMYESVLEAEENAEDAVDRNVSEILWARDETTDELQSTVARQRLRIQQLEAEVVLLRRELMRRGCSVPTVEEPPIFAGELSPDRACEVENLQAPVVMAPRAATQLFDSQNNVAPEVGSTNRDDITEAYHSTNMEPQPTRPQSAPISRPPTERTAAMDYRTPQKNPSATHAATEDRSNAVRDAYSGLLRRGPFAFKSDFIEYYQKQAANYGVPFSETQIRRKLAAFSSAGPDQLTFDEFSVLYLGMMAW